MQHTASLTRLAIAATLHCLTGCAIGEILGMVIGTALGLHGFATVALAVTLAFVFGYALSTLPLLRAGLPVRKALVLVLAADTLSIATMEIVDNAVMLAIPGAMHAGLANPVFWIAMALALTVAFAVTVPVNRALIARGKGHALVHEHHAGHEGHETSAGVPSLTPRRWIPELPTSVLLTGVTLFLTGGLIASLSA